MPNVRMPTKLMSIDSGMTRAVMIAARMFPRNTRRKIVTRMKPSKRFFSTV